MKMPFDYVMAQTGTGKCLMFDAKSVADEKRMNYKSHVADHQLEALVTASRYGQCAGLLVESRHLKQVYWLDAKYLTYPILEKSILWTDPRFKPIGKNNSILKLDRCFEA